MMKLTIFLALVAGSLASVPPMPAFLWTGSNSLLSHGTTSSPLALSHLAAYARSTVSGDETPSTLSAYLTSGNRPDVLLVFVQPQLQTSQMSVLGDAFNPQSNGGAFSNLKRFVESSPAAVTLPQVYADSTLVESLASLENVHIIKAGDAQTFLESSSIFNNGHSDVVIVQFDEATSELKSKFTADDEMMASIVNVVAEKTAQNYVAIFTASSPGESAHFNALKVAEQENVQMKARVYSKAQKQDNADANASDNTLYMTPGILSGLLIGLLLLLISCCGVSGLMALQTPDQWEKEGGFLAGQ